MLGIQYAESSGYLDAVGDVELARLGPYLSKEDALSDMAARKAAGKPVPGIPYVTRTESDGWYVVSTRWGCSVGGPQIRALRDPSSGNFADTFRDAEKLHDDPYFQALAAWWISDKGRRFDLWSTFRDKQYLNWYDQDYTLRRGHPRAAEWSK